MVLDDPLSLADRQAITDQIHRYCRSMDRIDNELGYSIWHSDGTADYGEEVFQGTGRGFIDFVCEQHCATLTHSHRLTNIVIELDGNRAASEAYLTLAMRVERDGRLMEITVLGRYLDTWSERNGQWAIDHRLMIRDMDETREVTALNQVSRGRRDRQDPSYEILTTT